jgi:hypothetical protein
MEMQPIPSVMVANSFHIVNDVGAWGAGFVLALSRKWKLPETEYRKWANNKLPDDKFQLGEVQFMQVEEEIAVANMLAQHNLRSKTTTQNIPLQYDSLDLCLEKVAAYCKRYNC